MLLVSQRLQRKVYLWQTPSQAILSHVPVSQIWPSCQVTYCNAALNVGLLPARHAHCACSWGSFPPAVIAGLCLYSSASSDRDLKGKVRQTTPPLSFTPWLSNRISFASHVWSCWEQLSVDYVHMLRESMPCLKAHCIAPDSLYLQSPPRLVCTCYCVASTMPWNFPVSQGSNSLWQSSWKLYAFCWASAITRLWNQPAELTSDVNLMCFDGLACSAPPVSPTKLLYCVKVDWKSQYK